VNHDNSIAIRVGGSDGDGTMKLCVCGGRDYRDKAELWKILDEMHKRQRITAIITGGAEGADHLAELWALENRIPRMTFYADWDTYGKAAGSIRNEKMLKNSNPDLVLAFPGGKGTADCRDWAKRLSIPVWMLRNPSR